MNERRFNRDADMLRSDSRVELLEVERVIKLSLDNSQISSVLDVGTGSGLFAEAFAKKGLEVSGIDINPEMIEAAKLFVPNSVFKVAPIENIPFDDKSFDLVFFGLVLHEADDYIKALKEAKRTAKIKVVALEWLYRDSEPGPPLAHRLKPEDVTAMAKKAGFGKIHSEILTNLILYIFE